uniref:Uncharacterized protein n=1 Tax=Arundo donax TaxID=35708 RepID=A0A0A8Y9A5_ARUDO
METACTHGVSGTLWLYDV